MAVFISEKNRTGKSPFEEWTEDYELDRLIILFQGEKTWNSNSWEPAGRSLDLDMF